MRKLFSSILFLCVAMVVLASTGAHAQATRTWVSGVGDDVNPCSRTAPCKTFAGAISKTAAGGEIDVLDPGGFGAVTITKSITIDGGGTLASVLASATNGINVNAGASDVIILRNLSINGAGTTLGVNGVNFLAGRKLIIENCTIENFSQSAISITPTGAAQAVISDSTLKVSAFGIKISTANATDAVSVLVSNTKTILNSNAGVSATVPAGKPGMGVFLDRLISEFNSTGVLASGSGATVTVGNSIIQGNTSGVVQTGGGAVSSFKTNEISNNGADGTPLTGISLN
ncbi:right-handed parallel beta-helix repeat-containing protein [Bradyrhizobium ontarionense]|uniref:Right-handed parallel beta-helix repeat-containing protein n=1 Tax=Bradyrhizobium ontarionense TaxID=2898149 RepID=A0ABY3RKS5_9BRAD|nr:right-handed parallel beta-helix repeat-containing protein [Bradyrhizobium sp. A19]UFZ07933.1 right-handed parallel beta-helix repeat-containing protein [Bradyrhizobium sp. A19]